MSFDSGVALLSPDQIPPGWEALGDQVGTVVSPAGDAYVVVEEVMNMVPLRSAFTFDLMKSAQAADFDALKGQLTKQWRDFKTGM